MPHNTDGESEVALSNMLKVVEKGIIDWDSGSHLSDSDSQVLNCCLFIIPYSFFHKNFFLKCPLHGNGCKFVSLELGRSSVLLRWAQD